MQVSDRLFRSVSPARTGGTTTRRRLVPTAAIGVVLLASCGDSSDSTGDASADSTVGSGSSVATTASPATPSTTAPEQTTTPQGSQPVVETTVASTTAGVPASQADAVAGGYAPTGVAPQIVGGATDPIEVPLVDGSYWSWEYSAGGDSVEFVLSQLFTGDACLEQFGDSDACASDNNTLYEPSATIAMPAGTGSATVLASDGQGGYQRFAVDPSEFTRLVAGQSPASDAPAGLSFERHPAIVTVAGGGVVAVDQVFMS